MVKSLLIAEAGIKVGLQLKGVVDKVISIQNRFFDSTTINDKIDELYRMVEDIYTDIAKSFFISAKQSVNEAVHSNNPEIDIKNAANHLKNAYNLMCVYREKKKSAKRYFFFSYEVDFCKNKLGAYDTCLKLALHIYELFCVLNEKENAKQWLAIAKEQLNHTLDYFNSLIPEAYYKSDKKSSMDISENYYKKLVLIEDYYKVKIACPPVEESEFAGHPDIVPIRYIKEYAYITEEGMRFISNYPSMLKELFETVKTNGKSYQVCDNSVR